MVYLLRLIHTFLNKIIINNQHKLNINIWIIFCTSQIVLTIGAGRYVHIEFKLGFISHVSEESSISSFVGNLNFLCGCTISWDPPCAKLEQKLIIQKYILQILITHPIICNINKIILNTFLHLVITKSVPQKKTDNVANKHECIANVQTLNNQMYQRYYPDWLRDYNNGKNWFHTRVKKIVLRRICLFTSAWSHCQTSRLMVTIQHDSQNKTQLGNHSRKLTAGGRRSCRYPF